VLKATISRILEETWPAKTDLVTNYRQWSTATQSGSGDSSTACVEQQLGGHSWKRLRHWQPPDDDDDDVCSTLRRSVQAA